MGVFLTDEQRRTCRVKWFALRDDIKARKISVAESESLTATQYKTMTRGLSLLYGAAFRLYEIAENDGDCTASFRELFEKLTEFHDWRDFGPCPECLMPMSDAVAAPMAEEVARIFAEARVRF